MNLTMKLKKGLLYKTGFAVLLLCIALSFYFYKKSNIKTNSAITKTDTNTTNDSKNTNEPNKTIPSTNTPVKQDVTKTEDTQEPTKDTPSTSTTVDKTETKPEIVKEPTKNTTLNNTNVEKNRKDLEELIFNYIDVYKTLINNKTLDITYINDTVVKNSSFETNIKKEIKDYRIKYLKINDLTFKIKSIESINNSNEFTIIVEEQVNYTLSDGNILKVTNNYNYSVVFDNQQSGIMKREVISNK